MRFRTESRKDRYEKKKEYAVKFPIEVVCPNFSVEENIAYVIRAAACFGVSKVNVIGALPKLDKLKAASGLTNEYIDIQCFRNPSEFLRYARENKISIISSELSSDSRSIYGYRFPNHRLCVAVGHETLGIPEEILKASVQKIYIPMPGVGYCLNTAQAANIIFHEYAKQVLTEHRDLC